MKIIPKDYLNVADYLKPNAAERRLLEAMSARIELENSIALLKIRPILGATVDICLIHERKGVFFFFTLCPKPESAKQSVDLCKNLLFPLFKSQLISRITSHKQLAAKKEGGEAAPSIPMGLIFYFAGTSRKSAEAAGGEDDFTASHCLFEDEISRRKFDFEKMLARSLVARDEGWRRFTDEELNALHYAVAPEYRIPKFESDPIPAFNEWGLRLDKEITVADQTGAETSLKALALTSEQIQLVNSVKLGPELIVSPAGSGKSVLLAARAFKTAKAFPDKKILLTCYNNPLQDYLNACIDAAGMKSRNLLCKTFHGLCHHLLTANGLSAPIAEVGDEFFDALFESASSALRDGLIKDRFFAIYIDEIQDFKKEWYQFCLELFENKREYILNVAGDRLQQIYHDIGGPGVWRAKGAPNCEANKLKLRKNFRSTAQINEFIFNFVERAKKLYKENLSREEIDQELFLTGESSEKVGPPPEVHAVRTLGDETSKVVECVKRLHDELEVAYSDIAVLFPYWRAKEFKCFPRYYIGKALEESGVPHCAFERGGPAAATYAERSGVVLSTIYRAKGVDFKAVVLCGLRPLRPSFVGPNAPKEDRRRFIHNINLLYSAATRAEEHLHIVLVGGRRESAYSELLWEAAAAVKA